MRFGHRARLTLVSAATSGTLLAGIFAGIVWSVRQAELKSVDQLLASAIRQANQEVAASPSDPDLSEIFDADPELSMVAFDAAGREIKRVGSLPLALNTFVGKGVLHNGAKAIVAKTDVGNVHLVAALPWKSRDEGIERLFWLLALIWAPLTAFASAATWLASRSTFRPLGELAKQAEEMGEASLTGRLHVDDADEYSEFAKQLNGFLDRVEQSVRQQERFVADAAHELRTPLTVLRGSLEACLNRPRSDGEYREVMRTALAEADRLSTLIEVLLRSAAPKIEAISPTSLEDAAEHAHARWVDRYAAADVRLDLEVSPATAAIAEAEMEVILNNLLSNALRVSPPGSRCVVRVFTEKSGKARICVEDEGPGVPPDLRLTIFDRFTRGDAGRNRESGGFGIGLAVCQRLVQSRGGSIWVEGSRGACFVIEFPPV